jgi:hypothetical protein
MEWMPISSAPKDRVILTNDNGDGGGVWTTSRWLEGKEWSGWIYDEEVLNDACPFGPIPTFWIDVPLPPPPKEQSHNGCG